MIFKRCLVMVFAALLTVSTLNTAAFGRDEVLKSTPSVNAGALAASFGSIRGTGGLYDYNPGRWINGCGLVYNCSWLNVRSGPGMSYSVLGTIPAGTHVEITGYPTPGNPWYMIVYPLNWPGPTSSFGYVYKDYINLLSEGGYLPDPGTVHY